MIGRAILHDLDLAKDLRTDLPDLALRSIAIVDQIISTDDLDPFCREVDRDEARLSRADLDLELANESEDRHLDLLPTDSRRGKSLTIDGITDILDLMDIGLCILLEADEHHLIAAISPNKLDRILVSTHIPKGKLEVPLQPLKERIARLSVATQSRIARIEGQANTSRIVDTIAGVDDLIEIFRIGLYGPTLVELEGNVDTAVLVATRQEHQTPAVGITRQ